MHGGRGQVIQGFFPGSVVQRLPRTAQMRRLGPALEIPPALLHLAPSVAGRRLEPAVQARMESLFGADFSAVRVHVGPQAGALGALAFTHGSDLYFATGQYDPSSARGRRLLAHELTHVVQQRAGRVRNPFNAGVAVVEDPGLEGEAERMATRASMAVPAPVATAAPPRRPTPGPHPTPPRITPVQPRSLAHSAPAPHVAAQCAAARGHQGGVQAARRGGTAPPKLASPPVPEHPGILQMARKKQKKTTPTKKRKNGVTKPAATQELLVRPIKTKDVEGGLGYFERRARLRLAGGLKGPGIIVQHVERSAEVEDISKTNPKRLSDSDIDRFNSKGNKRVSLDSYPEYYEAWKVPVGSDRPEGATSDSEDYDDMFSLSGIGLGGRKKKNTTKGSYEMTGEAHFYPTPHSPTHFGFAVDEASPAGVLPMTTTTPTGLPASQGGGVRHVVKVRWDSSTSGEGVTGPTEMVTDKIEKI